MPYNGYVPPAWATGLGEPAQTFSNGPGDMGTKPTGPNGAVGGLGYAGTAIGQPRDMGGGEAKGFGGVNFNTGTWSPDPVVRGYGNIEPSRNNTREGSFDYPQSWIDTYNQQNPATQSAIRARYSGMSPGQIMGDWAANVQPRYAPGTTSDQILGGASPARSQTPRMADPSLSIHSQQPVPGQYNPAGTSSEREANANQGYPGGRDLLNTAPGISRMPWQTQQSDYYNQHINDSQNKTNQGGPANSGDWAPGSGVQGKDPWMDPVHQYPNNPNGSPGQKVFAPGYGEGRDGSTFQWQGGKPPTVSGFDQLRMGGAPPQWLTEANAKYGLKMPTGDDPAAWDQYQQNLMYYMPDVEAKFKSQYPQGQPVANGPRGWGNPYGTPQPNNTDPFSSFFGKGPRDLSPIF